MITSKNDLKYYLREDAISLGISSKNKLHLIVYPNYIHKFQRCMRILEYYTNCWSFWKYPFWLYYKVKFKRLSLKLGFSIPINVFDAGLCIAHYGTIVINPKTKIGKNCRIHACVNIGASGGGKEAPTIGDNVYIGPGALIFGNISVADSTTIAANATVNKSNDKTNVVLAGVPAKIVKTNYPDWTQFNKRISR